MNRTLIICLSLLLAAASAFADPQSQYVPPARVPEHLPIIPPEPINQVLELAPLIGSELPPAPAPLASPEIPSPFLGCWEGKAAGFDFVSTFTTVGETRRIVFCYLPTRI